MKIVLENNCWKNWDWRYGSLDLFSIRWFINPKGFNPKGFRKFKYITIAILGIEFSILWGIKRR